MKCDTQKSGRVRRTIGKAVAGAAVVAVAGLTTSAPAFASASAPATAQIVHPAYSSYVYSQNSSGVNLRTCGSTSCGVIRYMSENTGVTMQCWEDTQWVYPPSSNYASPRWYRVSTPYGTGFVHSSLVYNQTGVGHC